MLYHQLDRDDNAVETLEAALKDPTLDSNWRKRFQSDLKKLTAH